MARVKARSCGVDPEASGLLAAGADADRVCAETADWLRSVYAPRALEEDAAGADRYQRWAAYFTGASLDLAEIYAWGWADLQRINARMWEIAAEVAPGAAVPHRGGRPSGRRRGRGRPRDRAPARAAPGFDRRRRWPCSTAPTSTSTNGSASATPGWPPRVRPPLRTTSRPART